MTAMIGMRFDLRVPAFAGASHGAAYRACLDQCEWADRLGLDFVALSEHHGVDDGYLPAPVTLAAAIGGRTKRLSISIAALLVPLHDPVRLAEELLHRADVVTVLEQVRREAVAQGMAARRLRESRPPHSLPDGPLEDRFVEVMSPPQAGARVDGDARAREEPGPSRGAAGTP